MFVLTVNYFSLSLSVSLSEYIYFSLCFVLDCLLMSVSSKLLCCFFLFIILFGYWTDHQFDTFSRDSAFLLFRGPCIYLFLLFFLGYFDLFPLCAVIVRYFGIYFRIMFVCAHCFPHIEMSKFDVGFRSFNLTFYDEISFFFNISFMCHKFSGDNARFILNRFVFALLLFSFHLRKSVWMHPNANGK